MEASTRSPVIDLDSLVIPEQRYVIKSNMRPEFFAEESIKELMGVCSTNYETLKDLELDLPELLSNELKVLIYVHDKFYHFFADTLPFILKLHKMNPAIRFVLYIKKSEHINAEPFLKVMFEVLEDLDVKWTSLISTSEDEFSPMCKIRNFVKTDETVFNLHAAISLKDVTDAMQVLKDKYLVGGAETKPWRKVYIPFSSGLGATDGFGDVYVEDGSYPDDARMDKPEAIEKYFVESGFEVVVPGRDFAGGIPEQIRFMSEVAVLASVSSSGLANALFMQPGGTVVELAAEVVVPTWTGGDGLVRTKQEIPLEFYPLSFGMGHTHLMIPTNRNAELAIKRLEATLNLG